ncbi:MAG: TPM domain-containing protein [Erysipelotrichaceae bacterium]|nr:TPM domain-containing protein [Erysipelotrichaceae bacterium]MDD3809994.1 TPM domain-containing protein [Erysipelotrichaceae bacterium]
MMTIVKRFVPGLALVVVLVLANIFMGFFPASFYERTNEQTTTTQRVFDYGDVLTLKQETDLEELIATKQKQTNSDIVLVTLDESLEEYAKEYDPTAYGNDYTMIYADNFYEQYIFGYNEPYGNGVMLVDNWYREDDGYVYSWMLTSGNAMAKYSSSQIDSILNESLANVDNDPYGAYTKFVNLYYREMTGNFVVEPVYYLGALAVALIGAVVATVAHLKRNKGVNTVTPYTYSNQEQTTVNKSLDNYTHTTVSRVYSPVQKSRSGGGGGSHTSGGGHSFGGGGHRR